MKTRYLLRLWEAIAIGGLLLFTLHVVYHVGGPASGSFYNWLDDALLLWATLALVVRAAVVADERAAWVLFALSLATWTAADIYYNANADTIGYPSIADALYLAYYPLVYVALLLLVRKLIVNLNRAIWLDGLVAVLAAAALGAAVLVQEVLDATSGSTSVVVTNVAYPMGDTLLLALVLGVFTLTSWRPGVRWAVIGISLAGLAVADGIYLFQSSAGTYVEGTLLDVTWPAAALLLGWAGWLRSGERKAVSLEGRYALFTPAVCGAVGIGVLVYGEFQHINLLAVLLAVATLVAVMVRTAFTFQENTRAHREIRRQKQFFESLVAISPVAVVVTDVEERVTGWNPAAAELFGHTPDEVIGRPIDEVVVPEEFRGEAREVRQDALQAGRGQRITRRMRKDGTLVDVTMMQVPLEVDGEHVGFYVIYHDITELQRAREEAEAATQAKSAFLATMSHEIRTPMNAVIGMTGLLLGTELSPEQREFAEVVRSSGDALLHVIDDILDYSKIEAGKLDLEREPFDLRECVEGALEIVAPRAMEKDVELGCLFGETVPAGIVGDAARLRQVLLNLLSNAVKFTEEGEVIVHVDAEPAEQGSWRLELAVRDTGIGIPQDRMDRLFASFSQVDTSTTRRYGGTGLGLAISKRIIELMGGTIRVESEAGKGSMFQISLRAQEAEVPERITADALPQIEGRRILVVDDNATNREIVTRQTRSWGMEPLAVELPSEALALLETGEQFDLAVLDMMMPEMDGLELAAAIRQRRDEHELPLVLLTSLGRLPEASSAKNFAAQLAKPIKASQLYNTLVNVLAEQAAESSAPVAAIDGAKIETLPLRILLAEDNAVNQKLALALLDRLGYSADVASNGREALEALERQTYDVVLMDIQMPELDGLESPFPPGTRPGPAYPRSAVSGVPKVSRDQQRAPARPMAAPGGDRPADRCAWSCRGGRCGGARRATMPSIGC